jgi:hypothetical protein|tara:strand:+ start:658 stop:789 length:132 start_codon:yes stop_codon:yes gene_type:complete
MGFRIVGIDSNNREPSLLVLDRERSEITGKMLHERAVITKEGN